MPIPIELTVYRGAERVARHHFERDIVKIGRLGSAHLKLDDKRVSRIHAVIEAGGADGGSYAIIDMGSAEGTFVNGRKVSKQWLVNGDTIAVGDFEVRVTFGGGTQDMATQDVVAVENLPLADELRTTASLGKALERTSLDALTPGNGMTTVTRSMAPSKDLSEVINTSISASAGDPGVSSGPRFSAPAQSAVAQVRAAEPFGTGGLAAAVDGLRRSSVSMVPPNGQVTPAEWPRAAPESFPHELVGEPTLQGGPLPSEWSNLPVEQVRQKIDKWTAPTGNMGVSEVLPRPPDDSVPPPPSDPTNGSQSAKGPPASPASSQRAKGSRSAKGPPASPASSQRAKGSRSVKKGPPGSPHRTKDSQSVKKGPPAPPGSPHRTKDSKSVKKVPPAPPGSPHRARDSQSVKKVPPAPPGSPHRARDSQSVKKGPPAPPASSQQLKDSRLAKAPEAFSALVENRGVREVNPQVPSNLASVRVPQTARALEVKLLWGQTVLQAVNVAEQREITIGDAIAFQGFGPMKSLKKCDFVVPSSGLPQKGCVLAERMAKKGATYAVNIPPGLTGRIERADGLVIPLELLYEGQHGAESDGVGGVRYVLRAAETLYLNYREFVFQVRYIRRTEVPFIPWMTRINYDWANILLLAFFVHLVLITCFIYGPEIDQLSPEAMVKNQTRFVETRLKSVEIKSKVASSILDQIKKAAGGQGSKQEGKAGRKQAPKKRTRTAARGRTNEREKARKALDKLLGLGGKGRAAGILAGRGLGGELKSAIGAIRGRQVGDSAGLGGLGTRGVGPGGGGLSLSSVGLGTLGTAGRGGRGEGGTGYGQRAASLGGKKDREVQIKAGRMVIRGSLSKAIIRRVVKKHMAQIRYCYEKELQRSPGLYGKVSTKWVISRTGRVTSARILDSKMNNAAVERCMLSKIRTWRFPQPKGGGIVEVNYPFAFNAAG